MTETGEAQREDDGDGLILITDMEERDTIIGFPIVFASNGVSRDAGSAGCFAVCNASGL